MDEDNEDALEKRKRHYLAKIFMVSTERDSKLLKETLNSINTVQALSR